MRYILYLLSIFFLAACTASQQVQRLAEIENAKLLAQEHAEHVAGLQRSFAQLQDELSRATHATWRTNVDCDACEESLLPPDAPLPPAEFAEFKSLLQQAIPIDPLPAEKLFIATEYVVNEQGKPVTKFNIHPLYNSCCGGAGAYLELYDAPGNVVGEWHPSCCGKVSSLPLYNTQDQLMRPDYLLPDAAFNRLFSLPTGVAFEKKIQHANEQTRALRSLNN